MTPEEISRTYDLWIAIRRWVAMWTDYLVQVLFLLLAILLPEPGRWAALGLWGLLFVLYFPLSEGFTGRTVGKWMCGLRVVDSRGGHPGFLRATGRTVGRLVDINPFLMGALPAMIAVLCSPKRQRLGDMMVDTFVLKSEDVRFMDPQYATPAPQAFPSSFVLPGHQQPSGPVPNPLYATTARPSGYPHRPLPPGQMRLPSRNPLWCLPSTLLFTVAGAALLAVGIISYQQFRTSHQPKPITAEQLVKQRPDDGYFVVKGGLLNLGEAASQYQKTPGADGDEPLDVDTITKTFIPLTLEADQTGKKTTILVETSDSKILELVKEIHRQDAKGEAAVEKWVEEHVEELMVTREITGTLGSSLSIDSDVRKDVEASFKEQLDSNYVVLQDGGEPFDWVSTSWIAVGALTAVLASLFWVVFLISAVAAPPAPKTPGSATYLGGLGP